MIAIVPSGTPSVSISITCSTSETKRAVPVTSAAALKTLSPVPTICRPCSSVSCSPVLAMPASGLYLSGSSLSEIVAETSNL